MLTRQLPRAYLTATCVILPVLLLLAACRGSSPPTATVAATPPPNVATATLKLSTSTPAATASNTSPTPTAPDATLSPCEVTNCYGLLPKRITPSPTSSLGVEAADLQGLTLRFWYITQEGDAIGYLPAFVSEFNKTNPWGIKVEIMAFDSPGLLSEQVRANLYSGNLPDVLAGFSYQVTSWDKNDTTLADLNAYLEDPVWGLSAAEQADFYPAIWSQARPGKRLSVPLHRTAVGLYYNLTWAKELGFSSPPTTPQAFEQQACAAARANGDGSVGWLATPSSTSLVGWLYAFGGTLVKPDGSNAGATSAQSPRYQMETPENLAVLTFLKGLQTQACASTTSQLYPQDEFSQRQALFVTGSTTGIQGQQEAFQSAASKDVWTVIPFPAAPVAGAPENKPVVVVYGPDVMIPASTPERQLAAWLFVRWLTSPEVQSRWVRADGSCPLRGDTLALLSDYAETHLQWASLVSELAKARSEPAFASWEVVRWVVADAAVQLFSPNFKAEGIPDMLKLLEQIANEAQVQVR